MLKSLFFWLDLHPGCYWAFAFGPTAVLLSWIALLVWQESSSPAGRRRVGWADAVALFLFLLAWRWPFLLVADELNPDESQLIAGAITLFAVVTAAHRQIGWALASVVMAALPERAEAHS